MIPDNFRIVLFPKTFREFPCRRLILNGLRALHILCLCILVGGFFFDQNESLLKPWFIGTLASGLGIFLIDLYGSCIALFEVRGVSVVIKLALVGMLPFLERDYQLLLLVSLILLSSLISHSPRRLRHWNFMSKGFEDRYGIQK